MKTETKPKRKLLASSDSLSEILRLTKRFYLRDSIRLELNEDRWEVFTPSGRLSAYVEESKGRFRLILPIWTAKGD